MRLIRKREDVLERLKQAGRNQLPVLCPNAETPEEMEGILLGAQLHAEKRQCGPVVVGIGFTATYPDHPQLGGLALPGADLAETARSWLYWLSGYADRATVFGDVEVIPFLDHGWAPHEADCDLMDEVWFQDALGILMFDASAYDFEENARLTAAFVQSTQGRVVVEGCPDKVYERAEMLKKHLRESDLISKPEKVERFVRETLVDLIVPNLGTEHRTASKDPLSYRRDVAQDICRRVGPIQALHGTSSLGGHLGTVGADGVGKINYYTAMAKAAAEAVRRSWPADSALAIGQACGSFSYRTRREAIAANIAGVLATLEPLVSSEPRL